MLHAYLRLVIIAVVVLVAAASDSHAKRRFADRVGTLELSEPLDSRGNLGGVAIDRLGFIYVANFRDAVWRISPEGEAKVLARSLYGSSGVALDSRGRLYQANFFGNTITRIERGGEATTFVAEGLAGPVGIAASPGDTLFVCNCSGNMLARVTPAGQVEPFAESELFACPNGITFDDQGTLYVTNFNSLDILAITPAGEVSRFVTIPGGAGNAHIAFAKGFFYVTKIVAGVVVKVSADGEFQTIAGTGQPGHDDGDALRSTFYRPNGIAVSPQGDRLYVNTLVGEHSAPKPSTMTVRTIDLVSLSKLMRVAIDKGSLDEAATIHADYKADSVRGKENTAGEMIALGYSYLSNRKVPEALRVLSLNAASYPDDASAQYHLGEAHRYTGGTEQAIAQYRRMLELDPDDKRAISRLMQLGVEVPGK